jgi:hypothetical protein
MFVIRTILIALIAISVVLLPATGEAAAAPTSATDMSVINHAGMPCCPSGMTQDDFKSSTCVLKCILLSEPFSPP